MTEPKMTTSITVNGVRVYLVEEHDGDGTAFVRIAFEGGDLEGEQPGMYYPVPHGA